MGWWMVSIEEQIRAIEEEILRTQKNKATEHHIGKLKAKLARLRAELEKSHAKKGGGYGFQVKKEGDATVALVGYPSVGKSSLLRLLTGRRSEVADYPFTTLTVIPGIMKYRGARVQILDLPGLIEGSAEGRGRGREVTSMVRASDLVLLLGDIYQSDFTALRNELYRMGIRLDRRPPEVKFEPRDRGGLLILSTGRIESDLEESLKEMARAFGYINGAFVVPRNITEEEFLDFLAGNRVYIPSLEVVNKIDLLGPDNKAETVERLKGEGKNPISVVTGEGIEELKALIFDRLSLMRVYLKPRGGEVDYSEPMILKRGATVREVCQRLHRDFVERFMYAEVWGRSVKFSGQKVGLNHPLEDEDVVRIAIRKKST
ncbi:MAG: GTP-binding protein [Thermoplasmata archaeon]|nr:MAG: GTP-binding protein [Thermoplasmata archaeon]